KNLVKRADGIIAVSEHTKAALIDVLQVSEHKITVAPLGVDQELFRPHLEIDQLRHVRNVYGLPGEFMLYVGTMEPRKNLLRIIEAFEQANTSASLVLAGKWGWKYSAIIKRIEQSPKKSMIKYLGYIPAADKPYLMKLARVFVWPSLYEGFGLPPLEAMAVGTPVLTSNVTSLPEVVGDAALMVNPYNVKDIASAMELLCKSETVRDHYIAKGIERARNFTWDKTAAQLEEVINELRK
ncbi:MAG: glycosyltransferase family 4 protein, partial [bacterium]|nr:glycosyltransferase family 4 protein [bacterium]